MAVQTTYSVYHAAKYAGAVNSVNPYATESKLNTDTVNIPFGYGVVADGETGMILPSTGDTAADFVGVAMRELNRAYADGETFGAPVGRDGTVVTHGRVAVVAGATVANRDPVFLGIGADVAGKFTNAAGTGATEAVEITGAKFQEAGVDGDAVWISLGLGG
ncbi:hypothetical protein NVP1263B_29 [Vibrio phage 1.263.B._10N.286.51.B1]|nr:hypothetical protein NVP1263A_29 [Vibrio phage 1.263.A._10N.286.51.B1]AUR99265.1 hypothetical protein NVP1263B_29 [Vibrio phage 1.263.B._10N.286.51.B1]